MAARAGCSPHTLGSSRQPERRLLVLYTGAAAMVVVVGVLGLVKSSGVRQALESWINIHALFGLLLCGLVIARYQWVVQHSARLKPADVRELSRHLSRIVYLMLYVVIGVRLGIWLLTSIWHGGSVDLALLDTRSRNGHVRKAFDVHNDYHMLLTAGVLALAAIRVHMFRLSSESVRRLF